MRKILIFSFLFLLFSCGNNDISKPGIIEETGDIVDGYVDTLEGSITDAKEVRKLMDDRYDELGREVNNIN